MEFLERFKKQLYWGAWVGFGLFLTTQDMIRWKTPLGWRGVIEILALNIVQSTLWGALSLLTIKVARKFPLHNDPPLKNWYAHLLASVAIVPVGLVISASIYLLWFGPRDNLLKNYFLFGAAYSSFFYLVCYWGVVGVHEGIQILRRYQQEELQVAGIEFQLAQAKLQAIKVQLNPHFLFNTLNAVAARMHGEPGIADKMLVKLSQLLRVSLDQSPDESISLEQEIRFMQDYLEIERMRFGNLLQVEVEIPSSLSEAQIPAFLLQPLLENAIKHGIAGRKGGGTVLIRAAQDGHSLVIEIQDDGTGATEGRIASKGAGIGLRNTRLRLEQLFGEHQSFELRFPNDGGAIARITLPLQVQNPASSSLGFEFPMITKTPLLTTIAKS